MAYSFRCAELIVQKIEGAESEDTDNRFAAPRAPSHDGYNLKVSDRVYAAT